MVDRATQFPMASVHASPEAVAAGLLLRVNVVVAVVVETEGTHTPQDSGQVLFM